MTMGIQYSLLFLLGDSSSLSIWFMLVSSFLYLLLCGPHVLKLLLGEWSIIWCLLIHNTSTYDYLDAWMYRAFWRDTSFQGNLCVHDVFGGNDTVQLKGPQIVMELKYLLNLLTLCWHFSKKPFPLFLEETGYTAEDVLLQEPKAGVNDAALS